MKFFIYFLMLFFIHKEVLANFKPLYPLKYDEKKALLGKKIFLDTTLSPKGDISCAKCHDITLSYSGVARPIDVGLDKNPKYNKKILYPGVINAGYNYLFYHDASAYKLKQQVKKSFLSEVEMHSTGEYIEKIMRDNKTYKKDFKDIYNSLPTFENAIDAVVEFEKSLFSLNSKFDKYLKGEAELDDDELEGYELFKSYACNTCHSGINIGGNIVAKLSDNSFPICLEKTDINGYYDTTHNIVDKNYIRVPSLRNVMIRAEHLYESNFYLDKIIFKMIFCKLGIAPQSSEIEKIKKFLKTLNGEKPKILIEEIE